MGLRPYQAEAVEAIRSEWGCGRGRTLLVMATGTGKTCVMSEMARLEAMAGGRTLLLAHRGELLDQAADKMGRFAGVGCGVEMGGEATGDEPWPVVVGSVQSMCRPARLARFRPDSFTLVMVDEAHHSSSASYRSVLDHFAGARVLGVTATPDRADGKSLADVFDSVAYEYGMARAVREGYLCPIVARQMPVEVDLRGVRVQSGDLSASDVGERLEPMMPAIVRAMLDAGCASRRTVAFLPLVATAERFAAECARQGLRSAEVHGESADRAEVLARFDRGEYDVLCNAMLLTEGWDCPAVDCVVPLRATQSRALYAQMVGRGTRPSPETGKRDLLLLDFLWQSTRHNLCRPASLVARDSEVADAVEARMADGEAADLMALEERAQADVVAQRERALAEELARQRGRRARTVDPLQYAMSIESEDLSGYEPRFSWERREPTDKQTKALENYGIDPSSVTCRGMASQLLDRLAARRAEGMSTPKQIRMLEQRGFVHVGRWTMDEAGSVIARIKESGWRIPWQIDPSTYRPERLRAEA